MVQHYTVTIMWLGNSDSDFLPPNGFPWLIGNMILPGKHTKNYGKSQFSMGKFTINGHVQ